MSKNKLETLFKELNFKTPSNEIKTDNLEILINFLQAEKEYRHQHKIARLLKLSGIKQIKTLNQFDWRFNPKVKKDEIMTFYNSSWVEEGSNLVLIGDAGLGKSHIARSLCYESILKGHTTSFITAFDLISKINKAQNPVSRIEYYSKIRVLCIDELGYTCHKKEDADALFQIISKRSELLPTIVTSNLIPKEWGTIFSGAAASAVLDRLSYNGRFITFEGRSYRLLKKHYRKK